MANLWVLVNGPEQSHPHCESVTFRVWVGSSLVMTVEVKTKVQKSLWIPCLIFTLISRLPVSALCFPVEFVSPLESISRVLSTCPFISVCLEPLNLHSPLYLSPQKRMCARSLARSLACSHRSSGLITLNEKSSPLGHQFPPLPDEQKLHV